MKLNTKQVFEIINVINKLGLKKELKELMLGGGENGEIKRKFKLRQSKYANEINKLIESKMTMDEYNGLSKVEQERLFEEIATDEIIKEGAEINKLLENVQEIAKEEGFNLIYTAIIERMYSQQEVIFKALSKIYNIEVSKIESQSVTKTVKMIKDIIECKDISEAIKVFI